MDEPQAAELPSAPPMPPRKPWLAAILAVMFGVVSLVYCGRLRRAALWFVAIWALALLGCAGILYLADSPASVASWACLLVVPHFAVVIDAICIARRSTGQSRRRYQRLWVYLLLIVGVSIEANVAAAVIRKYWMEAFLIPTGGMGTTILTGDRIVADKLVLRTRDPRYGDVVVHFENGPGSIILIKRVIGLPGDEIEIRDEQVHRNGELVDEPYARHEGELHPGMPQLANLAPVTVPPGRILLLGDNRRASQDSRFDGPYALADVIGVARVVFWSREYEWIPPRDFRSNPEGDEKWGGMRWSRIGRRLDSQ